MRCVCGRDQEKQSVAKMAEALTLYTIFNQRQKCVWVVVWDLKGKEGSLL